MIIQTLSDQVRYEHGYDFVDHTISHLSSVAQQQLPDPQMDSLRNAISAVHQ